MNSRDKPSVCVLGVQVRARRDFLQAGHYDLVAQAVTAAVSAGLHAAPSRGNPESRQLLDAGCGDSPACTATCAPNCASVFRLQSSNTSWQLQPTITAGSMMTVVIHLSICPHLAWAQLGIWVTSNPSTIKASGDHLSSVRTVNLVRS